MRIICKVLTIIKCYKIYYVYFKESDMAEIAKWWHQNSGKENVREMKGNLFSVNKISLMID